ncbi:anti-sigma factor RsrA [Thermobispora bispora]|jgi:mycothiol system anti-sigma-R factor|uniref:Anti-sigma factor n=1 Tax=Thermobispora bispora (strain ATCC 19993 / DSM 43833 / CBS 139.67 / JCM 10125 / KCTC 9307 / NBRC 14880 / R51) TaxID=469371 RepID=D6Y6X9_THEBD|nr:mycothiol system anti-sigma-R factor [Thermobispora bispora]MBO2474794.1 mycothiol system anti-sigma-R factor [Actinomycetales bacterium]MDI9579711.1 mycothiol system anti-sigma-R factor [Thermobispora sp.]ADG89620.1 anti-sigma factor [Thermobispora bispora DSM 43833]MBX6166067.1 mycothiol system anti-sigma-R factor [Thermobispora bispora]QSI49236.1 mycothiol system anti-sigma-R factor [Thermobispora bispora]
MSCGKHHDTPCSEVLEKVYTYLDGELDGEACAEIRRHLAECGPCFEEYGLEQAIKELIAKKCGCEPVPAALRTKIMVRIEQLRVELDG